MSELLKNAEEFIHVRSDGDNVEDIDEPKITINGKPLTSGQSMLVRVAVTSFHTEMQEPNALGDDEHGRAMVKGYRERAKEVLDLLLEQ